MLNKIRKRADEGYYMVGFSDDGEEKIAEECKQATEDVRYLLTLIDDLLVNSEDDDN